MERYRVVPGSQINLSEWDPEDSRAYSGDKEEGERQLEKLNQELESLQELLYAEHRHKVLIILQGMDTSGKDGTIRHVFEGVNPQGVRVASFKAPSQEELDHDFLWRIHKQVPGKGELVIFNRSQYEEVLIVRVHELVPRQVWEKPVAQTTAFDPLHAGTGTTILKLYLHIDRHEQKKR